MHILNLVFAQAQAPVGGASSPYGTIFMFGSLALIWYFLLIRPQSKQRKQHEATINALKKGDQIVTAGGIVGEVVHIKALSSDGTSGPNDHVTIKSGESRLVVTRGRIASIVSGTESAASK